MITDLHRQSSSGRGLHGPSFVDGAIDARHLVVLDVADVDRPDLVGTAAAKGIGFFTRARRGGGVGKP
jgi:hypothetical protein